MADSATFDSELLMWKNPVKTGAVVGCFNILFFIVVYLEGSLVPIFCNLFMLAIFVGGAVKFAAPQLSEQSLEVVPKDAVEKAVEGTAKVLNAAAGKAQEAVLWSNSKSTMKALIALEVVRRLAPWISLPVVLFLGGNSLFVLPYVLEAKKDLIEKNIGPHIKKVTALKDELLAKVPKYTDVVKDE
mmetsp:Transcript_42945/g.119529  ORF Transcript_42945/g.119529 Transcript_42945/m.119529 type:complete len:186 (-) Transcript_42945:138-695(-)|eukprot:CAMPEP_0179050204 /NCGR_PEP_ID=MMETSP0796-20121207/20604_1 /TAXON_ID=73915 /ORGANISM="Pyrodinium bahamense, Strain pbaha01" /LENGTH=185 /DNA_ID=CAMNT_0020746697 /DNA_START=68 /DNA_END=625 /DNA_ORIENTATION=+